MTRGTRVLKNQRVGFYAKIASPLTNSFSWPRALHTVSLCSRLRVGVQGMLP